MLDVKNLGVIINERKLLENINFTLVEGDKLAVIGEEGNGKSTLLKAIAAPLLLDFASVSGSVNTGGSKIGYVEQYLEGWNAVSVMDFFLRDRPESESDYSFFDGYDKFLESFSSLSLPQRLLEGGATMGQVSGGERVKLQICKALSGDPDMLILDEPTNDLDITTLEWLEHFLLRCKKPVMFVSHDEALLERVPNCILHLEQLRKKSMCLCRYERLGYADYIEKRGTLIEKQTSVALKERENDRKKREKLNDIYNKVDHELNTISRSNPAGGRLLKKKMKAVKSMEKRFEKERNNFTEIPDTEEPSCLFFDSAPVPCKKIILDFFLDKLIAGENVLSRNISLKIAGAEKICIVGNNGSGKTTLLRLIHRSLASRSDIKVGFMPQNYDEELPQNLSVRQYLEQTVGEKQKISDFLTLLGRFKFIGDELLVPICELSSGQKAKFFISSLIHSKCNVLVLDEPTRNLSPMTAPMLRKMLKSFTGAIIAVTHDRKLIDEVCGDVYHLTESGLLCEL